MKEIKVKDREETILVDDNLFELLDGLVWHIAANPSGGKHASTSMGGKSYQIHRLIMGVTNPMYRLIEIDHINGNGLDNQRKNLRQATSQQNNFNRKQKRRNPVNKKYSDYKGVMADFRHGKQRWRAKITLNGVQIQGGTFSCQEDAARAYDKLAKKYFGEFAFLNFPDENSKGAPKE